MKAYKAEANNDKNKARIFAGSYEAVITDGKLEIPFKLDSSLYRALFIKLPDGKECYIKIFGAADEIDDISELGILTEEVNIKDNTVYINKSFLEYLNGNNKVYVIGAGSNIEILTKLDFEKMNNIPEDLDKLIAALGEDICI